MQNTLFATLFVLLVATGCQAFAPLAQGRVSTSLDIQNAYTRGGKPSWTFEMETMYIEESPSKKDAPKKREVKKPASSSGGAIKGKMTFGEFFASPFGK